MSLEVIDISDKHKQLLDKLSELIPDLHPDAPESLQRIFGLFRASQQSQGRRIEVAAVGPVDLRKSRARRGPGSQDTLLGARGGN